MWLLESPFKDAFQKILKLDRLQTKVKMQNFLTESKKVSFWFRLWGLDKLPIITFIELLGMFDFPSQKKLLQPILKHQSNHICADCDTRAPTWASLDYGVFLCSNCSGAHRALGPTYTRVKSVNLDLWKEEWFACMLLGNEQLNAYWEADPSHRQRKPTQGASPEEIRRYVFEKYVKKRYLSDPGEEDPLSVYRKDLKDQKQARGGRVEEAKQSEEGTTQQPISNLKNGTVSNQRQEISLLQFDVELHPPPNDNINPLGGQISDTGRTSNTEFATSFTSETSKDNFVDFITLVKAQRQAQGAAMGQGHLHHSFSTQAVMQHSPINDQNFSNGSVPIPQQQAGQWMSPLAHQNYFQHPYPGEGQHSPPNHPGQSPSPFWNI